LDENEDASGIEALELQFLAQDGGVSPTRDEETPE
jgi:hypothetical protein